MSLSRPNKKQRTPTNEYKNIPESERYYIGRDKPKIERSTHKALHWWEKHQLGYKAKAWPKRDIDIDDDRYNMKEKETL